MVKKSGFTDFISKLGSSSLFGNFVSSPTKGRSGR